VHGPSYEDRKDQGEKEKKRGREGERERERERERENIGREGKGTR